MKHQKRDLRQPQNLLGKKKPLKINNMRKILFSVLAVVGGLFSINAQTFTEGFDNLANLNDWFVANRSPSPNANWGGGNPDAFPAHQGAPESYLFCNFQSTSSPTGATISNWLFTPARTFSNGDVISFYTRTADNTPNPTYPDRLEVRLSTAGNGLDVGNTETSVGTYTTLLLTINEQLTTIGYPKVWTQYTITISGLQGPTTGRIAFRYFVTNGGPNGANSDYIGIDTYSYTSVGSAPANDNCAGAINLTQGATCMNTAGSVAFASQSQPGCVGTANNDVWYRFTATSSAASITVDGSTGFDGVFQVFSGTCNNLTSLQCVDGTLVGEPEATVVNSLNVGQTYYIRVYDYEAVIPSTLGFDICVEEFQQCNLTQPAGSILEAETCGTSSNGGCGVNPPVYQDVSCGQTIFGKSWADNGTRDVDWYRFPIFEPGTASVVAQAEFPYSVLILDISDCGNPSVFASGSFNACEEGIVTYNFQGPGSYAVVIVPSVFSGYACNTFNDYFFTLNLPSTIPSISAVGATSFCPGGSVQLSAVQTLGSFEWTNNGIPIANSNASTFNANVNGNYGLNYTNQNGCTRSTVDPINVSLLPLDDASFVYPSFTACTGSSNVTPTTNVLGTFSANSPNLIIDQTTGEINVAASTDGNYIISYTTAGTCPNTSNENFTITSTPDASFSYANTILCTNGGIETVVLTPNSSTGIFSSTNGLNINATTGAINPSASSQGVYTVTNSIAASGACNASSSTFEVTIFGVTIDFSLPVAVVCEGSSVLNLNATPAGGTFSGTGVSNNTFDPALVIGSSTITYTINENGCTFSDAESISVESNPIVEFGNYSSLCSNASPLTLNQGTPAGGNYTGTGVTNNVFIPAAGSIGANNLIYSYVSPNGCSGSANGSITVNAVPVVSFQELGDYCIQDAAVTLQGTPTGGVFDGPGVTGTTFNPALAGTGVHTLTYNFAQNGCTGSASQTVEVDACDQISELSWQTNVYPNPSSGAIQVQTAIDAELSLVALDGRAIATWNVNANELMPINLDHLSKGQYLLRWKTENSSKLQKLILE
jgi:hypothetical protein